MIILEKYPYDKGRLDWLENKVSTEYKPAFSRNIQDPLTRLPLNNGPHNSLAENLSILGLHSTVVEHDIPKAKQYFYLSGLAKLRAHLEFQKSARSYYSSGIQKYMTVVFSDAAHLYPTFANFDVPSGMTFPLKKHDLPYVLHRLYQLCLVKKWNVVQELCDDLRAKKFDKEDLIRQRLDFFEALCSQNAERVEASLGTLLSLKSVKRDNYYFKELVLGEFMCAPGMWYAKLAWICGFEIEIDHPMIISELLPVNPLDEYVNPYDFLIDPVLENKELLFYGGSTPPEEVEKANQRAYGNTRFVDAPDKAESLTDFKIELYDRVYIYLPDMHQWQWEQSQDKFVFKNQKVLHKVTIAAYPFEQKQDLNRHLSVFLEGVAQSLKSVNKRTGNTFDDKEHLCQGIEFVEQKTNGPVYHYQMIKVVKVGAQCLCISMLCQYKDPDIRKMAETMTSWLGVK